ncbi:FAD-linked oxidase C-terminal domain-containing protein [Streptomyces sp. TLI_185]|uniref:FAD-linked oxidase C-terminal domain-containing protein n=1 Tax=Streptomyces sp. TLI_185 TaxID=2485151 RepID=UPI00160CC1A4
MVARRRIAHGPSTATSDAGAARPGALGRRARSAGGRRRRGPADHTLQRRLKDVFDPQGIPNPGKGF